MNRMLQIALTLIGLLVFAVFYNLTRTSDEYMLSERCGKSAKEHFKSTGYNGPLSGYVSHYNAKLNKCFSDVSDLSVNSATKNATQTRGLVDVNENKIYGHFLSNDRVEQPGICYVGEQKCQSLAEWKALIKPYMEQ